MYLKNTVVVLETMWEKNYFLLFFPGLWRSRSARWRSGNLRRKRRNRGRRRSRDGFPRNTKRASFNLQMSGHSGRKSIDHGGLLITLSRICIKVWTGESLAHIIKQCLYREANKEMAAVQLCFAQTAQKHLRWNLELPLWATETWFPAILKTRSKKKCLFVTRNFEYYTRRFLAHKCFFPLAPLRDSLKEEEHIGFLSFLLAAKAADHILTEARLLECDSRCLRNDFHFSGHQHNKSKTIDAWKRITWKKTI